MLQAALPLVQSAIGGLLVVIGVIVGARLTEKSKIREEERRNARLDTAVYTEVLAHLKAESEQVRLMYVTAIVVLSQLTPIHSRLVEKVFSPQTAQAFGDSAAILLDAVVACDSAYYFQRELLERRPPTASAEEARHEILQVRGIWNRPFEQLQAFFAAIGESDEVAKFEEARQQQATYIAAGLPVPLPRG
jgi:hypothetical protein